MASGAQELETFVRAALERGSSKPEIEKALSEAGWSSEQTRSALSVFADIQFPVPVPKPRPHLSAREAFLYLVLYTTLYLTSYYLGCLLFELIDHAFPDLADTAYSWQSPTERIRWAASSIVVAFPIFLFLSWHTYRELARDPAKCLLRSVVG